MKKISLLFCLVLLTLFVRAQNGLECVAVEVYYVSDATDSLVNDGISATPGTLPVGSVTYRVYADLLQGYKLQGVYGVDSIPIGGPEGPGDHELRIETTGMFYNNEDRGAVTPNAINNNFMNRNTVMLDSWLSVGAASSTKYGVMKSADDGIATVSNVDGALQNNSTFAGIPLTQQDGLISGSPAPEAVTLIGFTTPEQDLFNNTTVGNLLSTYNATWASLNGSIARPDSGANKVLIGQFTTKGTFSFKLNIQIGTPTNGVERYVAENPIGSEIMLPCLTFNSNSLTTGLSYENSSARNVSIYPNPANDIVTLELSSSGQINSNVSYDVYDLQGQNVLHKNIGTAAKKYSERVDLSQMASGMYFFAVSVDGNIFHQKIIKN